MPKMPEKGKSGYNDFLIKPDLSFRPRDYESRALTSWATAPHHVRPITQRAQRCQTVSDEIRRSRAV